MIKPTRLAALYLGAVFLAGALFGFVAHAVYSQKTARAASPAEARQRYIKKLQQDLSLTPEQLSRVTAILDETGERFREIRKRMDPEFEAIRARQRAEIMAVLTPEQQPKYQRILEEWKRQREQRERER